MNIHDLAPALCIILVGGLISWLSARRLRSRLRHPGGLRQKPIEYALLLASTLLFGGIVLSTAGNLASSQFFWRQHPPSGKLVDVGGYRMHLDCMGSGSPTLILEAGGENNAAIWQGIQPALAKTTTVCSYDRAGLGHSDPQPGSRDADNVAAQLHALLETAGIRGPVVFMGHSIAGLFLRDYLSRYPENVVGLILIDSSTPFQYHDSAFTGRAPAASPFNSSPWLHAASAVIGIPRLLGRCRGKAGADAVVSRMQAEENCRFNRSAFAELSNFDTSSRQALHTASFPNLPVLIISHDPEKHPLAPSPQTAAASEAAWTRMQEDLKKLSTRSRRVVARGSGHSVMLDRPDLLVTEVTAFLEEIRHSTPPFAGYGSTITE
jgi:pimeloyl-ACP methyl ester carboxylesterase